MCLRQNFFLCKNSFCVCHERKCYILAIFLLKWQRYLARAIYRNNNNISLVLWHYLVMNHVVYTFISWWGRRFFPVPLSSLFPFPLTLTIIFFPYCHLLVLQMGFCAYHCGKRFHTTLCLAARDTSFSRHTYPILRTASDIHASVSWERLLA